MKRESFRFSMWLDDVMFDHWSFSPQISNFLPMFFSFEANYIVAL